MTTPPITSRTTYQILPVPALRDNYIWLLHQHGQAVVIDPGEAAPVLHVLEREQLRLSALLVTHHHHDHVAGIAGLRQHFPDAAVYGPHAEAFEVVSQPVHEGTFLSLPGLAADFVVIATPGHTHGHLAYYDRNHAPTGEPWGALFCGDTLFSAGCGRLFEGSPQEMQHSLARLRSLPGSTRIYPAHEYTEANLRFARCVEPDNQDIADHAAHAARLRAMNKATLPSTLALECRINPFLRWDIPAVQQAAAQHGDITEHPVPAVATFAALRAWKDRF